MVILKLVLAMHNTCKCQSRTIQPLLKLHSHEIVMLKTYISGIGRLLLKHGFPLFFIFLAIILFGLAKVVGHRDIPNIIKQAVNDM